MRTLTRSAGTVAAVALALGLIGPIAAHAAASPGLGGAASYSIVAGSIVTNAGLTTVSGDLGVSPSIGVPPHVTGFPPGIVNAPGAIYDTGVNAAAAQTGNTAAFTTLDQGCTTTYVAPQDLTLVSPLAAGVYCSPAFTLTGNLTLTGSGVWIFKSASSLITSPGSSVTGGDPCNIWWRVVSSATLDTTTSFEGNILALTSIGLNGGATLNGRAMAQTGAVTLNNDTITGPTCAAPPAPPSGSNQGLLTVVKTVVNDNGGAKTVVDFPLFVNGTPVISGETNRFNVSAQMYHVTETGGAGYASSFSGDCNAGGDVLINRGDAKVCIITNNDIGAAAVVPPVPPLIDVVKVPSPLALPNGSGAVTYTYTLTNIGTVPVTDITMVGDACTPVNFVSGDANGDKKLDVNETWKYTCQTNLSQTTTNTVTATGWANGISATDVATATVVVGTPVVPPLIHLTKIPAPLALLAGGGTVTYTEKITNPGTVPLSNVALTDDKCAPMKYISGDANGDSLLDPSETWTYTCASNLNKTTTNTAIASGTANGMTVRDLAIATVVVASSAVPALPKTGFDPSANGFSFIAFAAALAAVSLLFYAIQKKIVA